MFFEILLAVLIGILAGCVTGLIPGIHVNLVSLMLVSFSGVLLGFAQPITLGVFIISLAVTHTFLDSIPSIYLGAPDSDMALGVLPGHKMLLEGKGYEAVKLTVIGSLLALVVTIMIIPMMVPLVPLVYGFLQPYVGWILILVVVFMILKENGFDKRVSGAFVFVLSGVLGLIVLGWPNLKQPLFPMLSGLFGVSTLLMSLTQKVSLPKQKITDTVKIPRLNAIKAVLAAVFSGSLTGIFPGLGAAQAAIIALSLVGHIGMYSFMILIGGINTVNFVFSLVTFYTLEKARNGAVVAVMEVLKTIDASGLIIFLGAALLAGGISAYLALVIAKVFSKYMEKVNYHRLISGVIIFITVLVAYFSGLVGLMVLFTSTAIGMLAPLLNIKRSNAMGCLLLPVILFFVL